MDRRTRNHRCSSPSGPRMPRERLRRRRARAVVALGAAVALLAPAAVAQAEPDRHPMDPLGANFGPARPHGTDGEGPRTPRQPDVGRSASGSDGSSGPRVARQEPVSTTQRLETDEEPVTGGSVADRIARSWPGNDRKAIRVARCESGLNPSAYSPAGPYYGIWQFDAPTWRSVGGSGLPSEASVEEQTRRAWELRSRRGWAPWPVCGHA